LDSAADTTNNSHSVAKRSRSRWRWIRWLLLAFVVILLCLLRWGGYLLIADDPLPAHVDTAVVLQGSIAGEQARVAGAMQLLRQGAVGRVLLSVPRQSYWGEPVAPVAHRYLEKKYDTELTARVDFCETGPEVNSTEQEARTLIRCIQEHGWQTVAIVTSNYHTRRAGIIWTKTLVDLDPTAHHWMHAVADPEFQPRGWWRQRLSAKTWFLEFLKLTWTTLFG
jgi:uncharacterized SAM-binding protein YcdF (DUF218 family)